MGRDKILGLSLAILLIGFAGAFCFRNEPIVENGLKLARAKFLDDAIGDGTDSKPAASSQKRMDKSPLPTVTLQGIETVETPAPAENSDNDGDRPAVVLQSPSTDSGGQVFTPASPADRLVADERPIDTGRAAVDSNGQTEVIIRPRAPLAGDLEYGLRDSDGRRSSENASTASTAGTPGRAKRILHRVRRGDTLTKIATIYLGDRRRYLEIFEANRDQMENPDDRLQIGMILKIPRADEMSRAGTARAARPINAAKVRAPATQTRGNVARARERAETSDESKGLQTTSPDGTYTQQPPARPQEEALPDPPQ